MANRKSGGDFRKQNAMKAKAKTSRAGGIAKTVTKPLKAATRGKRRDERDSQQRQREVMSVKAMEHQRRRQDANRETRQELARMRHKAGIAEAPRPTSGQKAADRGRLKGKGLFYCPSPQARAEELQRRLSEASAESPGEVRPRRSENR